MIAARDAEATLPGALDSLLAQSDEDWEALVIDDGSRDSTAAIARDVARRDPRVRLAPDTDRRGPAAARNAGLAGARFDVVLFLDAGGTLTPGALRALSAALSNHLELTATHGGWRRLSAQDGLLEPEHGPAEEDLFPHLARRPVFPAQACLGRTAALRAVGGFDESLPAAEEWDLWQRLARGGARFAPVPEVVCVCGPADRLATSDLRELVHHGLGVIRRGHSRDPRVADPVAAWAHGLPDGERAGAQLVFVAWAAGLLLGREEDATDLLDEALDAESGLGPPDIADAIAASAPVGAGIGSRACAETWPAIEPAVGAFLAALEQVSQAPALADRTGRHIEVEVARRAAGTVAVGRAHRVRLEVTEEVADIHLPDDAERVVGTVTAEGEPLATVTLPACDGMVPAEVIADAVADRCWWPLLGRFFRATVYHGTGGRSFDEMHDEHGWEVFLRELWGRPESSLADFYPPPPPPPGRFARLRPVRLPFEVSGRTPRPPKGPADLLLVASVAGSVIGIVRSPDRTARGMRAAITSSCAIELCRSTVREAVLGRPFTAPGGLRARLADRAAQPSREPPPGLVLGRHAAGRIGTSASRRARLPASAGADAAAAASAAGEPVDGSAGGPVTYVPERVWAPEREAPPEADPRPADDPGGRRHRFEALFASRPDPWGYTSPYERRKYEQTLALVPQRAGRAMELACGEGHFTTMLAPRCESLVAADISQIALRRAAERCAEHPNVSFRRLDLASDPLPDGCDLVCCSEVLYFVGDREDLPRVAERLARALATGGLLVTCHANALADDSTEPGFDWDVPFGARAIGDSLSACPLLQPVRERRSALYRIASYRRVERVTSPSPDVEPERIESAQLPAAVARTAHLEGGSHAAATRVPKPASTSALPILVYHQIDASGGPWSVSPSAFAEQLAYLADAGYHTITFADWWRAVERRLPPPGRAVMLTFDDGYRDFAENAWPELRRHGFGATTFVVTDRVGGVSRWDGEDEPGAPLLGWDDIRELDRAGVEFGSHTATHPHLMACTPAEVVHEAARSRRTLTEQLRHPPTALAYPFGDVDPAVAHLVGACGFAYGLTVRRGPATHGHPLLELPRIEVRGDSMERFIAGLAPRESGTAGR